MSKKLRHQAILDLVRAEPIGSQEQLRALLEGQGFVVTQSTLSRDIKELELMKGSRGYQVAPPEIRTGADADRRLELAVHQYMARCVSVRNQVVLRTSAGHAQALAVSIDESEPPGVLGTLAGDDTVLVITTDDDAAARVADRLLRLADGPS